MTARTRSAHETLQQRARYLARVTDEVGRWRRHVDSLCRVFRDEPISPALPAKLESLRNKRDTFETKARALERHRDTRWLSARLELELARRELRDAWRTVIGTLDREGLYV